MKYCIYSYQSCGTRDLVTAGIRSKISAIQLAKSRVSGLNEIGNNYAYLTWIPKMAAWHESIPMDYWRARAAMSQARINIARESMRKENVQYEGGAWTKYL